MKIRFEINPTESIALTTATAEITGETIDFLKEEESHHKWGSASKNNGVLEIELKSEFILDCIDAVKSFAIMVKGLIPAFEGLFQKAQDKMSKWTSVDLRELTTESAKVIFENYDGDIVVVANHSNWEWVDTAPNIRKKVEVCYHTPITKKTEMEEILASDKDAKFYIFSHDGSFKEATIIEAVSKLW